MATNALLERKGQQHALLITKGFKVSNPCHWNSRHELNACFAQDLLVIGNQSRPKIFDLNIRRPSPLYSTVVEVDERVTLIGYTSNPKATEHAIKFDKVGKVERGYQGPDRSEEETMEEIVRGLSGEAVKIMRKPGEHYIPVADHLKLKLHPYTDLELVKKDLQRLHKEGYRSLAICFVHSYTYPDHELAVGDLARSIGFTQISISSQLLPMIKMVPRGISCTADAYLTPILRDYLDGFFGGFDEELRTGGVDTARVEFMASDGGLLDLNNFSGLKSILSGPAGGVVGYALTSWDETEKTPIIG